MKAGGVFGWTNSHPRPLFSALLAAKLCWKRINLNNLYLALNSQKKHCLMDLERGVEKGGWVPQQLILKHPATEGVSSRIAGDQGVQARLLSGVLKVGVEVVKGDEDGLFTKEGVHEAIMAAMTEETQIAKQIRENHDRLKGLLLSEGDDNRAGLEQIRSIPGLNPLRMLWSCLPS
ncbi:hypothetical protein ACS0TY_031392 [Phlomoides rotata]